MMILLLLFFLLLASFILFSISRHDFVLIRQSISLRLVFDRALLISFVAFIIARIFFAIDTEQYDLLTNPLKFFHVLLYWGFNFLGFFTLLAMGVFFFYRKRKNYLRILDIYMLAFSPLLVFQVLQYAFVGNFSLLIAAVASLALVASFGFLLKKHAGFRIRDGVSSFLVLIVSSGIYFAHTYLVKEAISIYSPIQIFAGIVVAISLYCLLLNYTNLFKSK